MGRIGDKIIRKKILGLTRGRRAWYGMLGRRELGMGRSGDKIIRKKTWDGMQVRGELRMGRGGDKNVNSNGTLHKADEEQKEQPASGQPGNQQQQRLSQLTQPAGQPGA